MKGGKKKKQMNSYSLHLHQINQNPRVPLGDAFIYIYKYIYTMIVYNMYVYVCSSYEY